MGIVGSLLATACDKTNAGDDSGSGPGDSSSTTAATTAAEEATDGGGEEEARALCEGLTNEAACDVGEPPSGYVCRWRDVQIVEVATCGVSSVEQRCFAAADQPSTPGCVPQSECTEPEPLDGVTYLAAAWREETDGSAMLVEACGGGSAFPLGFEPCTFDPATDHAVCPCACDPS